MTAIEEIIRKQGGRLDSEALEPLLRESYTYDKGRCLATLREVIESSPTVEKIEFDIIDDYSFNAFACGEEGNYFIGINRGLISTIRLLFSRIFADSQLLPSIGNIQNESKEALPLLNKISPNYEYTVGELTPFNPPQDRERLLNSKMMAELALDLILAHEISHIRRGHVDFAKERMGVIHDELHSLVSEEKYQYLSTRTLEMDADHGSVRDLLGSELDKLSNINKLPSWLKGFYRDDDFVLWRFSFVVSVVHRIFAVYRVNLNQSFQLTHPIPQIRSVIALSEIMKYINEYNGIDLMIESTNQFGIPNAAISAYNTAEIVMQKVTGNKLSESQIRDVWGDYGQREINTLSDHYNKNLIEKLREYAHIGLQLKELV